MGVFRQSPVFGEAHCKTGLFIGKTFTSAGTAMTEQPSYIFIPGAAENITQTESVPLFRQKGVIAASA